MFSSPALDELNDVINGERTEARIDSAISLTFDLLGAAGTAALALGKINPRLGIAAIGTGALGHYLPEFLPIHQLMTISRKMVIQLLSFTNPLFFPSTLTNARKQTGQWLIGENLASGQELRCAIAKANP